MSNLCDGTVQFRQRDCKVSGSSAKSRIHLNVPCGIIVKTRSVRGERMRKAGNINIETFYPENLKITEILEEDTKITIALKSTKHRHICPSCEQEMSMYHGTYSRTVQDLPILSKNVLLRITAYEYYCTNEKCEVGVFVENHGGFVSKCGRMTRRLEDLVRTTALETNCEGAAAICKEMGIRISGDSIIRMLRELNNVSMPMCSDTVGIDDFAYRKGQTYCTVICDGATHEPIEVLDGRDGKALREWLRENKQVKRVTRDRAGVYAKAISEELPDAMQIADRFHLHQNLLNAVKEALRRELSNNIAIPNPHEAAPPEPEKVKKNGSKPFDRS